MDAKLRAAASVAQAKAELDRAIAEIDSIESYDPSVVGLIAHALSNYISVTGATVEMLQRKLHDSSDSDVTNWLAGIRHAADLMQHSLGRLVSLAAPRDFPLKRDYVNLAVLMERACQFHQTRAEPDVQIVCRTMGYVPLALGDRVALAVIADNLLAHAVRSTERHGTVRVQVFLSNGDVACSVEDAGGGFTAGDLARLFAYPTRNMSADERSSGWQGLVIAREFARRMDGDLWCESEPGQGARFTFRIPSVREPA